MNRLLIIGVCLTACTTAGCGSMYRIRGPGDVQESRAINTQTWTIIQGADPPALTDGSHLQKSMILYKTGGEWQTFQALLGENSEGYFDQNTATYMLTRGWVYLCGEWPQVRNGRVTAGAEGCAMAMEITPDTADPTNADKFTYRIYLYSGVHLWAEDTIQHSSAESTSSSYYLHVLPAQSPARVLLPSPGDPIRSRYDYIRQLGGQALNCD